MNTPSSLARCPCGSEKCYADCCQPWHDGAAAPTAEALMRSRYVAFVLELAPYLLATWHASTRPADMVFEQQRPHWLGLQVKRYQAAAECAEVEFVARYKINGRAHRLHEISQFVREEGRWFYVEGEFPV